VLSPARRERLKDELSAAPAWVEAAKKLRGRTEEDRRWHQIAQTLDADIDGATLDAEAADADHGAAAPRWARIELARKAAPLQPLLDAADRAVTQAKIRAAAHDDAKTAAERAQKRAAAARAAAEVAEATHTAAQAARHAAAPDLDLARGLDAQLASARAERDRCALLADAAEARARQIAAAVTRLTEAEAAHRAAKRQAKAAREQLDDRKAAAADQPIAGLANATDRARSNRDAVVDRVRHLERMRARATRAVKLTVQIAEQRARIDAEGTRRCPLEQTRSAAKRRLTDLRVDLDHARAAPRLSRAAEDLSGHRAALHSGDPCPLCGATEHPGIDPALIKTDRFQARVAQVEGDISSTQTTLQDTRTKITFIDATLEQTERSSQQLDRDLQALISDWDQARERASSTVPADPTEADALDRLKGRLTSAEADHAAASTAFSEAKARLAAEDAIYRVRDHVDAAEARVKTVGETHNAAQDHKNEAELKARDAKAEADRAEARLSPLLNRVDRDGLEAAPDATLDALEGRLDRLAQAQPDSRDAGAHVEALQGKAADARAESGNAANAAKDARAQAKGAVDRMRDLESRRVGVLEGRPVATVSAALDAQVAEATDALNRQRLDANKLEIDAEGAKERLGSAITARTEAEVERGAAVQRLRDAFADAGLDRAALERVRALSRAALLAEAKELEALRTRRDKAHSVVEERCAKRGEHDARGPAVEAASAAANWQVADRRYDDTVAPKAAAERALDHDDAARDRCAALSDNRTAAVADRALWGQLDEVIGSATGATFRELAQSLTLDAVIEQANHHLQTLARRYQLMRVPKENPAVQVVDRDMGDEVRTVKSLSGGETFLVSLALALGLASLSARDTRIGSLFIDEGFGSLDTDTLDVVLDALDALQADGRQIGLISHVPGLAQRIGAHVLIEPTASGLSEVKVIAGLQG
jgi:exonuclease SbcC